MNKASYFLSSFLSLLLLATICTDSNAQSVPDRTKSRGAGAIGVRPEQQNIRAMLQAKRKEIEGLLKINEKRKSVLVQSVQALTEELDRLDSDETNSDLPEQSINGIVEKLQSGKVELMIDLAGLDARREEILKMKEMAANENNELISDLEELLEIEQKKLKHIQALYEKNLVDISEGQAAKSRLLEARIRLAEAKQPSRSESILTEQLLEASLERAEKNARLKQTESILSSLNPIRGKFKKMAEIRLKRDSLNREIEDLDASIYRLRKQLSGFANIGLESQPKADEQ